MSSDGIAERIVALVEENGCVSFSEVAAALGLPHATAWKAIDRLVRAGALVKHKIGRRAVLCVQGAAPCRYSLFYRGRKYVIDADKLAKAICYKFLDGAKSSHISFYLSALLDAMDMPGIFAEPLLAAIRYFGIGEVEFKGKKNKALIRVDRGLCSKRFCEGE
jgi:predicted transcriptional regulator